MTNRCVVLRLLEDHPVKFELDCAFQNDRPEFVNLQARLLKQLSSSGLLSGLLRLDAAARCEPPGHLGPSRVASSQQEHATVIRNQDNASRSPLLTGGRHRPKPIFRTSASRSVRLAVAGASASPSAALVCGARG
jgi:hypothetical protein